VKAAKAVTVVLVPLVLVAGAILWFFFPGIMPALEGFESEEVVIADVSSERLTRLGSVVGFEGAFDSHAWHGIPFAEPPVGNLRWRPPRRPQPWADTLDALAYGSACVQLADLLGGDEGVEPGSVMGSEDCLRLNVWAPRYEETTVPSGGDRLPVMFWIHGGGNTVGSAGPMYEGSKLAASQGVLVVSTGYRLGPFGWFAHPALAGEGGRSSVERSGNFGTLDLIAALEWVRENIEYFGGDPANVTIFGESAGGTNVVSLLLSPRARGLFHRAVVQSGSTKSVSVATASHYFDDTDRYDTGLDKIDLDEIDSSDTRSRDVAGAAEPGHRLSSREVVLKALIRDGSASDRSSAKVFTEGLADTEMAEYLRGKSSEEIMTIYRDASPDGLIDLPRIIRDGIVVPVEDPLTLLAEPGRFNSVPTILGSNRDEIKLFFSQDPRHIARYLGIIVRMRDPERYERLARHHSNLWKVNGVDAPARALGHAGGTPVYGYRFDWDEEPTVLGADVSRILGAAHALEIPFLFGLFRFGGPSSQALIFNDRNEPGRIALSEAMMSYWAEFAYRGSPGRGRSGDLPEWLPWVDASGGQGTPGPDRFIVLDTAQSGGIRMSTETRTRQDVVDAVDDDDFFDSAERCRLFADLFHGAPGWNEGAYREVGRHGCAEHPLPEQAPN